MNALLLIDVSPDPVSSGAVGLVLLVVVLLILTAVLLLGFVLLLRLLKRRTAATDSSRSHVDTPLISQPTSPNQP